MAELVTNFENRLPDEMTNHFSKINKTPSFSSYILIDRGAERFIERMLDLNYFLSMSLYRARHNKCNFVYKSNEYKIIR